MSYRMTQAIGAYRAAATTVPPPTAVTLLLDEALNAIVLVSKHMRNREHDMAFMRMQRAIGILRGLRQNVDQHSNPDFAEMLIEMYTRNIFALNAIFAETDTARGLANLSDGLLDYRNSWAEMTDLGLRCADVLKNEILNERTVAELNTRMDSP